MIKRPFLGIGKPKLHYKTAPDEVREIKVPKQVTLLLRDENPGEGGALEVGAKVKTGQRLSKFPEDSSYVISSVTGTISKVFPYVGSFGEDYPYAGIFEPSYTAITIDAEEKDEWDDEYKGEATLDAALRFFEYLPGNPSFQPFVDPDKNIRTIVVYGQDPDLLLTANQVVLQNELNAVKGGVKVLKEMTGVDRILLVALEGMVQQAISTGAEAKALRSLYPSGLPHMVMKDVIGTVVPEGQTPEDMGVLFMSVEAVAALGTSVETGRLCVNKMVTLAGKGDKAVNMKVRIGTPLRVLLQTGGVTLKDRDRLVLGGPMRGTATYSDELPVEPKTNGVVVQAQEESPLLADHASINCGECVRICPVKIPVNMLVRYLEAGLYEEARDMYELECCIECGLCAYVCPSRIPIFQYIKLAKRELDLGEAAEAENE